MEDDDEFGDLYTDVLNPFSSSSAPESPPAPPAASSGARPIDLNLQSDDEEIFHGASNPNFASSSSAPKQALVFDAKPGLAAAAVAESVPNSAIGEATVGREALEDENWVLGSAEGSGSRVLEGGGVKLHDGPREDRDFGGKSGADGIKDEGGDKVVVLRNNFDIEDATGIGDTGSEPIIPGLSIGGSSTENKDNVNFPAREDAGGEGDDWDSDSEDDLQIVLNDNMHGPTAVDRGGVEGSDDEDEDGEPLVIVADEDPTHQPTEEQEWGEDAAQAADGERKEIAEAGKANGGIAVAPKIGYSNHGYHPFHSQFKYVRPGATPIPGAVAGSPGGAPGQVRPLVNMGPIAGRGRGDWRPTGIKAASSMQKNFHSGFGSAWGNNAMGRGFGGGLEFTLPSHKTIFDIDIDSFEEKPWRFPGIDMSDFFNFGLTEDSWKDYCKQLEQLRLESTMQSKIRVYESGRAEQEYDPDLPPELAAATGIRDVAAENANTGNTDSGQNELAKGSARVRPPLPTGRAIQVEGGYGERLPSIDTRPPRIRDSDAIIEIVLQGSVDDDSSTGNGDMERTDNNSQREDFRRGLVVEDDIDRADTEYFDDFPPHSYNGRKREPAGRRAPFMNTARENMAAGDGILPFPPDAPTQCRSGSRGQTPTHPSEDFDNLNGERRTKGRTPDRSPHISPSQSSQDKKSLDNRNEESVESIDGKHSPVLSSPATGGAAQEQSAELEAAVHDGQGVADGDSIIEQEDTSLGTINATDAVKDDTMLHTLKKQKLNSRVEQPVIQETDDAEEMKTTRSSETSKASSGSSRDYPKWRDGAKEEVVQDGHLAHKGNVKGHLDEDETGLRRSDHDAKQDIDRNRSVVKGRDESYPKSANHLHMKTEAFDRRKERDISVGAWQRRDEDPHGRRIRAEDTRKRERGDEMGSRHKGKVRESERSDRDEYLYSSKKLDNGSWRGHHDKELGARHRERDDNLKSRYENADALHGKRRKDEDYPRRDHADKEEILHGYRETGSRRKREREDVLDMRKRDELARMRESLDDHHSVRHKDDGWLQRERNERQREKERDEWHRLKQTHEENLHKREREEGRGAVRSGRGAEDKAWIIHARVKDEYKGSDKDYQSKDVGRHSDHLKRRDRIEDESLQHRGREDAYARGNQFSNENRRSRQERSSTRNDHFDNQRLHDKKSKDNSRKIKESEGGDHSTSIHSKRNQEEPSGQMNEAVGFKGTGEQGNSEHEILGHRHPSRKRREYASSDDEHQDSKRGRSKLERWTSHKERDYNINTKLSSSLKVKEIDKNSNGGSSLGSKLSDESLRTVEAVDNPHALADEKDAADMEIKDADTKPMEDRHLDTVAKLKKRSERFKLPMPGEKDNIVTKKMENEALPPSHSDNPVVAEIKPERPARKRRWISN